MIEGTIMITGAGGLMGRHLVEQASLAGSRIVPLSHADLDIRDSAGLRELLKRHRPGVVINAAALCSFDRCEDYPELSEAINLKAAIQLAELAAESDIRVVQFSSDYIFDGQKLSPYTEDDPPRPHGVYARHKAALETAMAEWPNALTLRLAWVFGQGGPTFMSRIPELLMTRPELTVAAGKRGSCLHAEYGARVTFDLVEKGIAGLVNLVHDGETAWEHFAEACLERLRARGLDPRCENIRATPFQEMPELKPGRPEYSVLATDRLRALSSIAVEDWQTGLERYLDRFAGPK